MTAAFGRMAQSQAIPAPCTATKRSSEREGERERGRSFSRSRVSQSFKPFKGRGAAPMNMRNWSTHGRPERCWMTLSCSSEKLLRRNSWTFESTGSYLSCVPPTGPPALIPCPDKASSKFSICRPSPAGLQEDPTCGHMPLR